MLNDTSEGYSANAVGGCARTDGMEILVKTYEHVFRNRRESGESFEETLLGTHRSFSDVTAYVGHGETNWLNEDKGEGIDYRDPDTFVTLSERDGNPFPQYFHAHLRQSVTEHSFHEGVSGYAGATDAYLSKPVPTANYEAALKLYARAGTSPYEAMIHFANLFGAGAGRSIPAPPFWVVTCNSKSATPATESKSSSRSSTGSQAPPP